jgi:membrane fusion protein, multidrug efflux system
MSDLEKTNNGQGTQLEAKKGSLVGNNHRGLQKVEDSPEKKKRRRGPRVVGSIVLVVLIAVGVFYGRAWLIDNITYTSTDDAIIDGNHVNISTKMLGRIQTMAVQEGSKVQPGQLLVTLDDADLRAQATQASAALAYAKDNLLLAKVSLDRTQDDFNRTSALYKGGSTTREQYEHASSAMDTANAQYAIAQAQIDTSNAQLGVIENQLLNTRITAPIAGVVATKTLMPGDVVQPSQTIYTINDLSHIWVTANFEETKLSRIHAGAPVSITVDAYNSHPLTGKVALIGAGIVPSPFSIGDFTKTTQRVPIKILLDPFPESMVLLPGMSVEVKIKAS